MDWGKVVESAIGTFTGGAIALASMWIKEIIDRRKASQVWYEQHYIAEGIDRLMSYVRMVDVQMTTLISGSQLAAIWGTIDLHPGVERMPKSETHEAYPHEALVRLEILLNDDTISAVIAPSRGISNHMQQIPPGARSQTLMISTHGQMCNLYSHLKTIRAELLKVKIKKKPGISDVPNRPGIKHALLELAKFNDEWAAKTMEREQQISQGK